MNRWLLFIVLQATLFGQDFTVYQALVDEGKIIEVQRSLPYLKAQYPNHPFVKYIEATTELDGEVAFEKYKEIINKNPNTLAAEMSNIKITEYLYSVGLYTQASEYLKIFPNSYPESRYNEHAFKILEKSLRAIGESDSIEYYRDIYQKYSPIQNLVEYNIYEELINPDVKINKNLVESEVSDTLAMKTKTIIGEKPWIVQVGAFGERKNADIIVNRLITAGYDVEVIEKTDRVNLYLVQIVRFESIEQAINVGEKIQNQFGLDFRIAKRN
jgi:hypothetical protein